MVNHEFDRDERGKQPQTGGWAAGRPVAAAPSLACERTCLHMDWNQAHTFKKPP